MDWQRGLRSTTPPQKKKPRCSCPAAPPCAEQSPGSCPRCFLVPLHQEPGSERSSSRTRGTHLASDGPHLWRPWGLSCCAPRPAVRAQRRHRARNIVPGAAPGHTQCRCTREHMGRAFVSALCSLPLLPIANREVAWAEWHHWDFERIWFEWKQSYSKTTICSVISDRRLNFLLGSLTIQRWLSARA